jgi:hypothetical protein
LNEETSCKVQYHSDAGQVGDIKRFAVLLRSERASHALDTFDHFD